MSLGKLVCSKNGAHLLHFVMKKVRLNFDHNRYLLIPVENWNAITLLDNAGYVEVPSSVEDVDVQSIGFAFRTSAKNALILHKPSIHYSKPDLRLILTSGTPICKCFNILFERINSLYGTNTAMIIFSYYPGFRFYFTVIQCIENIPYRLFIKHSCLAAHMD